MEWLGGAMIGIALGYMFFSYFMKHNTRTESCEKCQIVQQLYDSRKDIDALEELLQASRKGRAALQGIIDKQSGEIKRLKAEKCLSLGNSFFDNAAKQGE